MNRILVIVTAAAAGAIGTGVAVPALASSGSSASPAATSTTSSLSSSQLQSIEDFLADHPNLAQALAGRAASWQKFLAANPAVKAELDKVATLSTTQRRAALKTWLQANPDAKAALEKYRIGLKQARLSRQQDRLKQRLGRIGTGPSSTKPSSSSGAAGSTGSSGATSSA
jgi:hemophore-related protein